MTDLYQTLNWKSLQDSFLFFFFSFWYELYMNLPLMTTCSENIKIKKSILTKLGKQSLLIYEM